jgi:hypothetical protein
MPPCWTRSELQRPRGSRDHESGLRTVVSLDDLQIADRRAFADRHGACVFVGPIAGERRRVVVELDDDGVEGWVKSDEDEKRTSSASSTSRAALAKPRLAVAVAEQLMQEDRKHVLLIDLNLQTNATVALISEEQWAEMDNDGRTIAQLFEDRLNPHNTPKFDIPRPLIVWLRGPATGPVYRCARLAST